MRREERRIGAERIGWQRRHAPGADRSVKRGLGMAQSLWGANVQTNAACEVRIMRDGSVEVLSSVQDIGTGIGTVMAQTVAEVLGLRPEEITVRIGDTEFPPAALLWQPHDRLDHAAGANRRLEGPAMLFRDAALALNAAADDLIAREGRISCATTRAAISFSDAAARLRTDRIGAVVHAATIMADSAGHGRRALAQQDLGGVQFAEVTVDTETGIVRVERVVAVQDCGRPINPRQIESQVQGGVLMGISYALFEERILDQHDRPHGQRRPRALQARRPARDAGNRCRGAGKLPGQSATDAYGIAEPANIATAPAIANAVYNATGVRLAACR